MLDMGKFCHPGISKCVLMTSSRWLHTLLIQGIVVNIFKVMCEIKEQIKMFFSSFGVLDTVSQLSLAKVQVQFPEKVNIGLQNSFALTNTNKR